MYVGKQLLFYLSVFNFYIRLFRNFDYPNLLESTLFQIIRVLLYFRNSYLKFKILDCNLEMITLFKFVK